MSTSDFPCLSVPCSVGRKNMPPEGVSIPQTPPPNDLGLSTDAVAKENEAICLLRDQMAANLACKSNEALEKTWPPPCAHSYACACAHGKCWSQGSGSVFSTCTLRRREQWAHAERLGGKWSYCAARVANAKQGMKTADFLPTSTIGSFLRLQPG